VPIHHKPWRISFRYQQVQATSRFPDSAERVPGRPRRTIFGGEGGRAAAKSWQSATRQCSLRACSNHRRQRHLCSCIDLLYYFIFSCASFHFFVQVLSSPSPYYCYARIDDTFHTSSRCVTVTVTDGSVDYRCDRRHRSFLSNSHHTRVQVANPCHVVHTDSSERLREQRYIQQRCWQSVQYQSGSYSSQSIIVSLLTNLSPRM
jgi:hypothetical protein